MKTTNKRFGKAIINWRRKSMNRYSEGKSHLVEFESDAIPGWIKVYFNSILAGLGDDPTREVLIATWDEICDQPARHWGDRSRLG